MSIPSSRQPVFEMLNDIPVFTRPWYLFLTGQLQSGGNADTRLDAIDQEPMPVDTSPLIAALIADASQAPGVEELRATITEMQRQIDALTQVP